MGMEPLSATIGNHEVTLQVGELQTFHQVGSERLDHCVRFVHHRKADPELASLAS